MWEEISHYSQIIGCRLETTIFDRFRYKTNIIFYFMCMIDQLKKHKSERNLIFLMLNVDTKILPKIDNNNNNKIRIHNITTKYLKL